MLEKLKGMLVSFVKPLLLAHLKDLTMLAPMLAKVLVDKSHMSQEQANALALNLVDVIETELAVLINKI